MLEDTFRHVNIALVNELAMFGHEPGVNVWEAINAASTKPFGFMPLGPEPAMGGHCLPIDPVVPVLAGGAGLGQRFRFVELAHDIKNHMSDYVVHRLLLALNQARGGR